jgi:hypothetical protein
MPKTTPTPLTVAAPVVCGLASSPASIGNQLIPPGDNFCLVQLQNPGTATIFIEGSPDAGLSWDDLPALRTKDNLTVDTNSAGSGFTPTAGKNGSWWVPMAGHNSVRVRSTAQTGSPVVNIISITGNPPGFY